jgi:hypothetical protein
MVSEIISILIIFAILFLIPSSGVYLQYRETGLLRYSVIRGIFSILSSIIGFWVGSIYYFTTIPPTQQESMVALTFNTLLLISVTADTFLINEKSNKNYTLIYFPIISVFTLYLYLSLTSI